MRKRLALLLLLAVACSSSTTDDGDGDNDSEKSVALPGVTGGVLLDDLHFAASARRIVIAPGGSRRIDRVDVDAVAATSFDGFGAGTASVDEANGLLFAVDRQARQLDVVDAASGKIVATTALGSAPDYVRYNAISNEVWVTEPIDRRIEMLKFAAPGSPALVSAGFIAIGDGPEGLAFDVSRKRAFVHHYKAEIGVIDVDKRAQFASWPTECASSHGIPAVDEARGLVFAGCRDTSKVTVLSSNDGKVLGRFELGGGVSVLAYSSTLGHAYLRGDPGAPIAVLGVDAAGATTLLGKLTAAEQGHVMAADDRGYLWAADPRAGKLLRFKDSFAASK